MGKNRGGCAVALVSFTGIESAHAITHSVNWGSTTLNSGESDSISAVIPDTGVLFLNQVVASFDYNEPVDDASWASDLQLHIDDSNGNSVAIGGFSEINFTSNTSWTPSGGDTNASGSYTLTSVDNLASSGLFSDGTDSWTFTVTNDWTVDSNPNEYNNVVLDLTMDTATAAVPFEFSPSLGLLLVGGLFGTTHLYRRHQARKVILK